MNITFLIGNGFDLNLGLKTGYKDFLKEYINEGHDNELSKEIQDNIDTWADLERQLGIHAGNIAENQAETFLENKDELEASLTRYLQNISKTKLLIDQNGALEFRDRIVGFYGYLTAREQEHYRAIIPKITEAINYVFVDFNYTEYLDQIFDAVKKGVKTFGTHVGNNTQYTDEILKPIHIHGYLGDGLILGINDETQIPTSMGSVPQSLIEYMSKPLINEKLGNQRATRVKSIIDKSIYICVYGMSLGNTDLDWWTYIAEWLCKSSDHRLVLFMYDDPTLSMLGARAVRKQDSIRRQFLKMVGHEHEYNTLSQQIIVQLNSQIFNFEKIKLEA